MALASLIGGVLFYLFILLPTLPSALDAKSATRLLRLVAPKYYTWGATAAAISLPSLLGGPLSFPNELRGPAVGVQAMLILAAALLMLYSGNSLTPAINSASDTGPAGEEKLRSLLRRALWLNGSVLLIGVILVGFFVTRPTPKTTGLQDVPPEERAQKSMESFLRRQAEFEAEQAKRKKQATKPH
jgi:hypothetical protein